MPSFDSLKSLEQFIKKSVENSAKDLGKYLEKETKDQIDKDVYSYTPREYDRTFELRDSIISEVKSDSNSVEVEIKHDTDKINPYEPNQHMSVLDGSDISNAIPEIVHDGKAGKIFGEGFWTKPRPYMDNTVEKLKESKGHVKKLKEELKKYGIDAE